MRLLQGHGGVKDETVGWQCGDVPLNQRPLEKELANLFSRVQTSVAPFQRGLQAQKYFRLYFITM